MGGEVVFVLVTLLLAWYVQYSGNPSVVDETKLIGAKLFLWHSSASAPRSWNVSQVSLEGNDHLLLRLASNGTTSFVVKRFTPDSFVLPDESFLNGAGLDIPYRHATLDFLREQFALHVLNDTFHKIGPRYYGSDPSFGVLVQEDIWWGRPLYEYLGVRFRHDQSRPGPSSLVAPQDSIAFSLALPKLGSTFARLHDPLLVNTILSAKTPESRFHLKVTQLHDTDLFENSQRMVQQLVKSMDQTSFHSDAWDVYAKQVVLSLTNPGVFLALTHGDVCADNIFLHSDDLEPLLLDFSSAGLRHALWDISSVILLFPTCWCAGDIPQFILTRFLLEYRKTMLQTIEQHLLNPISSHETLYFSPQKLVGLARVLRDETLFEWELEKMAFFHLVIVIAEYWEDAYLNKVCGHVRCSAHITSRVAAYLQLVGRQDKSPGNATPARGMVHSMLERLYVKLVESAPPERQKELFLPPFPTLGKLHGNAALISSRMDMTRLEQVQLNDCVPWLERIQGLDPVPQQGDTTTHPNKLVDYRISWSALHKWTSLHNVILQSTKHTLDPVWTIKRTTKPSRRFPIGCCEHMQFRASSYLENEELKSQLLSSNYYSSMILDPGNPEHGGLLEDIHPLPFQNAITTLWVAGEGSITPLHYDPFDNTFVQIYGTKRFLLFPPRFATSAYLYPRLHFRHRQSQVNLNDPDRIRFPDLFLLNTQPRFVQQITVNPGDVVRIPAFWLHQVEALSKTDSISVALFTDPQQASGSMNILVEQAFQFVQATLKGEEPAHLLCILKRFLEDWIHAKCGASRWCGIPPSTDKTPCAVVLNNLLSQRYRANLYFDALSPKLEPPLPTLDPHVHKHQQEEAARTSLISNNALKSIEMFSQQGCPETIPKATSEAWASTMDAAAAHQFTKQDADAQAVDYLKMLDFIEDIAGLVVGAPHAFELLRALI